MQNIGSYAYVPSQAYQCHCAWQQALTALATWSELRDKVTLPLLSVLLLSSSLSSPSLVDVEVVVGLKEGSHISACSQQQLVSPSGVLGNEPAHIVHLQEQSVNGSYSPISDTDVVIRAY